MTESKRVEGGNAEPKAEKAEAERSASGTAGGTAGRTAGGQAPGLPEKGLEAVIAPVIPGDVPVHLLPPIVLAYIGDAVFEVYVRQRLILEAAIRKPQQLHKAASSRVSAAAQARLLEKWQPLLTEEEADVARRGRNTKSGQPPKNADPAAYRLATGLECLVGYLYYRGERDRLEQLIGLAFEEDRTNE